MLIANLIDNVWATKKTDSLNGFKLMLVEIAAGKDKGVRMVAIDTISAGIGDRVLVCTGSAARRMVGDDSIPVDAAIVGIIDEDCKLV